MGGWYIDSGKAYIVDISDSNAVGENITFSLQLNGFGKPLETDARIRVLSNVAKTMIYTHPDEVTVIQTEKNI